MSNFTEGVGGINKVRGDKQHKRSFLIPTVLNKIASKHYVEILDRTCIKYAEYGNTTTLPATCLIAIRQQISRDTESFLLVGELLPVPDFFFVQNF